MAGAGSIPNNSYPALATNADGTVNSRANPAHYGSRVSLFVQGVGANNYATPLPSKLLGFQATVGQCSWTVQDANLINAFVYKVDIGVPAFPNPCFPNLTISAVLDVTLNYQGTTIGPLTLTGSPQGMFV